MQTLKQILKIVQVKITALDSIFEGRKMLDFASKYAINC